MAELVAVAMRERQVAGEQRAARERQAARDRFAMDRDAPRAARHFVVDALSRWDAAEFAEDAAMVATELATNAIVHARSGFTVAVMREPGGVRIAVRDDGPVSGPGPRQALTASPGHGLWLVDTVSTRWAAERAPGGTMVWAELS
jgi:anti-sigma regulatory factor (Ser/Thr protein kinase)